MNDWRLVSERFPYISLRLTLGRYSRQIEALIDTGFDVDVIVPINFPNRGLQPFQFLDAYLADRSQISVPTFAGVARIGKVEIASVLVLTLGDVAIVGTNVISRFTVTLDHGRRVIVEP
jgi:predicted aspartyl protease